MDLRGELMPRLKSLTILLDKKSTIIEVMLEEAHITRQEFASCRTHTKGIYTMENDFHDLGRQAESYIGLLRATANDSPDTAGDKSAPHMEEIDFDRLCDLLARIRDQFEAADRLAHDAAVVRQWLTGRIVSFRRGRQAVLNSGGKEEDGLSMEVASLPDLIHRFEEASALLRKTATGKSRLRRREGHEYLEFKS